MPKCDICRSSFKILYRDQDYNCKDCLCEKCYTDTWGELPEPDDWNYPEELKETKPKNKKKIKLIKATVISAEEEAWKKYREDDGEEPMVCGNVVDGVAIIGCGGVCYRSQQPETWSYGYWSYCKDCQEEEEKEKVEEEEAEEEKRDWWGTHGDGVVHLKYATEEYMDINFEEWGAFEGLIDTREEEEEE